MTSSLAPSAASSGLRPDHRRRRRRAQRGRQVRARRSPGAELGALVLRVDEFVPGWRGLAAMPPMLARDLLAPIARASTPAVRRWDWDDDSPGDVLTPARSVPRARRCGSGSRVIRPFLSMLIWVDAPADVRRARAMARDGDVYGPWWDVWAAQEQALFAAEQTRWRDRPPCGSGHEVPVGRAAPCGIMEPLLTQHADVTQLVRVSAFQAECCEFESRRPLDTAQRSSADAGTHRAPPSRRRRRFRDRRPLSRRSRPSGHRHSSGPSEAPQAPVQGSSSARHRAAVIADAGTHRAPPKRRRRPFRDRRPLHRTMQIAAMITA